MNGVECEHKSGSKKGDPRRVIRCFKEMDKELNVTNVTESGKGNTEGLKATGTEESDVEERQRRIVLNKVCMGIS